MAKKEGGGGQVMVGPYRPSYLLTAEWRHTTWASHLCTPVFPLNCNGTHLKQLYTLEAIMSVRRTQIS